MIDQKIMVFEIKPRVFSLTVGSYGIILLVISRVGCETQNWPHPIVFLPVISRVGCETLKSISLNVFFPVISRVGCETRYLHL